ncbi:MAG: hypothetical protein MRERC_1c236 [Mycoplasmataceae bacterium RC_NB112A]|nr:MAG: hypothetical protein MRERC_1c236 [Mycoplasmataceae bacterium RC_NB112A]
MFQHREFKGAQILYRSHRLIGNKRIINASMKQDIIKFKVKVYDANHQELEKEIAVVIS